MILEALAVSALPLHASCRGLPQVRSLTRRQEDNAMSDSPISSIAWDARLPTRRRMW